MIRWVEQKFYPFNDKIIKRGKMAIKIKESSDKLDKTIKVEIIATEGFFVGYCTARLYPDGDININEHDEPNHNVIISIEDLREIIALYDKKWGK